MKIKFVAFWLVLFLFMSASYGVSREFSKYLGEDTLEYKLAVINAGFHVSNDHFTVNRFRTLLNELSYTYVENRQQIADMSVKAQQILKERGIKESLLNIMEGLNQIFTRKIENQKYAEYAAAYLTLRSKGESHRDAILGLKALVEAII
jgi:hypothetical protein